MRCFIIWPGLTGDKAEIATIELFGSYKAISHWVDTFLVTDAIEWAISWDF